MSYSDLVIKNAPAIGAIENSLRSLSYILPGRFPNAEIGSEALYGLVGILSHYHDSILRKETLYQLDHEPSQFNKYTRHLLHSTSPLVGYTLMVIQTLEVLGEMIAAEVSGEEMRWNLISSVEAVKFICRSYLLAKSGGKMLLHNQTLERDFNITELQVAEVKRWRGIRTQKRIPTLKSVSIESSISVSDKYLISKSLIEPIPKADELVSRPSMTKVLGELLFVVRPLVYRKKAGHTFILLPFEKSTVCPGSAGSLA
ncbi:Peroxisomal membrane protein pex16 [Blyttiomyces sp. JEL0837]|nr:Peroxisomal membrane protein pex16 [Blyttiomyces sp. JEL0837]